MFFVFFFHCEQNHLQSSFFFCLVPMRKMLKAPIVGVKLNNHFYTDWPCWHIDLLNVRLTAPPPLLPSFSSGRAAPFSAVYIVPESQSAPWPDPNRSTRGAVVVVGGGLLWRPQCDRADTLSVSGHRNRGARLPYPQASGRPQKHWGGRKCGREKKGKQAT